MDLAVHKFAHWKSDASFLLTLSSSSQDPVNNKVFDLVQVNKATEQVEIVQK